MSGARPKEDLVANWIVTGGASGIGLQICCDAAQAGHAVEIWDLKPPPAEDGFRFREVDLTRAEAVAAAAAGAPAKVDAFIHCAGVFPSTTIVADNLAQAMMLSFQVHAFSFVLAVQGLLPKFAPGDAAVVAITSAGMDMAYPGTLAYGPSKAALQRAVVQLAVELGDRGVRVNAIAPGAIATDMTRHMWQDPAFRAERTKHIPLGRQAEPKAVSDAVAFLASDAAAYVTGTTLWVDGGVRHGIFQTGVRELMTPPKETK
jgi:NAD(P)-dependent dehydrogenase (short-subunit alcohol dehydrogenase family)